MSDYKSTLNLPKTEFPMSGNLANKEPKILAKWIENDLYRIIRSAKKGKKTFILHDGPPYANGNIHLGHSVNKILKDIIIKFKGFSGFDSPYIPGWDCHGLPIELKVEQKYGEFAKKFTAAEFRKKCRKYAEIQINNQRKDFIRLGILGDWSHPYLTMDFKTEANIIRTLSKIISNGHLYRGKKPVNWCIDCHSTLAEAEVEYYKKTSSSIYVTFKAVNQDVIIKKFGLLHVREPISIVIWTTTPWSLPANCAISISPKIRYALVQIKEKALILAKDLVDNVMKRAKIINYTVLAIIDSNHLELTRFKHPFLNFDVPIVLSDHVTLEVGTGVVHIAGNHGLDDYNISIKYGLKIANKIRLNGTYFFDTHPLLDNINIFKGNDIIINILRSNNELLHVENIQHSYPYCWRHKTPIIFLALPQWFISMDKKGLRNQLIKEIRKRKWIPEWCRSCIELMVKKRPDWCISRQRTWGVPMSIFIHKKTHELHPRTLDLMEQVAKRVEIEGIQAWWNIDPYDIIGNEANFYEKVLDTLDVWFDSGSTHASVVSVRPEFLGYTSDMYLEGSDQHRGWFMSSLIISTAINGKAPYSQVLTHGFVVDSNGHKMSKFVGNTVSPHDVIDKLGADILRLWVASSDYTSEIAISDKILKIVVDNYRRIRNTARFILGILNDFNPSKNIIKLEEMVFIDRWAVDYTKVVQENIINSYESFKFHEVVQHIMQFCSIEMSSFYFNIIKDRQYTVKSNSVARRSCQTASYHIIEALVRWIAPIISFTADEIWEYLPGKHEKYIFTGEWYKGLSHLNDSGINNIFWNELLKIRSEVNKEIEYWRSNKKIGDSLEIEVVFYAKKDLATRLSNLGLELKFFLLVSNVKVIDYINASIDAQQSKLIKGLKILLNKAEGKKCQRCWHYTTDIGSVTGYLDICRRCVNNIIGDGEKRKFF